MPRRSPRLREKKNGGRISNSRFADFKVEMHTATTTRDSENESDDYISGSEDDTVGSVYDDDYYEEYSDDHEFMEERQLLSEGERSRLSTTTTTTALPIPSRAYRAFVALIVTIVALIVVILIVLGIDSVRDHHHRHHEDTLTARLKQLYYYTNH